MRKIVYTLSTLGLLTAGLYATSAQASVINTFWDFTGTAPASNAVNVAIHDFVNDTITVTPMDVRATARTATAYSPQSGPSATYFNTDLTAGSLNNVDLTTPALTPTALGVGTASENIALRNRINIYDGGTITVDEQTELGHNLATIFPGVTSFDIFKQDFIFLDLGYINQFVNVNYFPASYSLEITLAGVNSGNPVLIDGVNSNLLYPNPASSSTEQQLDINTIDITSYIGKDYLYITTLSGAGIQLVSMRFSFEECGIYKNCNGGGDDGGGDDGGGDDGGNNPVSEPGAIALLGFSLAGLALLRRKQ